jgi:uncharacterized membrane protein YgcG
MRWVAPLVLVFALVVGGEALAATSASGEGDAPAARADGGGKQQNKKGKKGGKKSPDKPRKKKDGIQVTGIKSFDKVFKEVGAIDNRLASAETELRLGRTNLNAALGLPKGTPFADALADLQNKAGGNLRLGLSNGAIPKLEAADAVPANVQNALDGFNGFTENITSSITDVKNLSKDISGLVDATTKMPQNLIAEFSKSSGGGVNIIEKLFILPGAVKATGHNIKIVTGLDDRVTGLSHRMTDLVDVVNSSFKPMPDKGRGNGGNTGDGKGKGKGKKKGKGGGGKKGGGGTGGRPIPGR